MGIHRADDEPATVTTESGSEPVVISHAITVILAALVATGWAVIPDKDLNTIASVAALVITGILTVLTRSRVQPTRTALVTDIEKVVTALLAEQMTQDHEPQPWRPGTG